MIFHEIYSKYFDAMTRILQAVIHGHPLNWDLFFRITNHLKLSNDGFNLLKEGLEIDLRGINQNTSDTGADGNKYRLFTGDGRSKLLCCPEMPLTTIEKRWLRTILCDPRIQLFDVTLDGVEDVEPFYLPEDVVVYDREGEGDPWNDSDYRNRFRTILHAMRNGQNLHMTWLSRESLVCEAVCRPNRFEYSELDDRMRLWADTDKAQIKVTLGRVLSCEVTGKATGLWFPPELVRPLPVTGKREQEKERRENVIDDGDDLPERLVLEITDVKNALERAFFHFSSFQKQEVVSIGESRYRLVMSIDFDDREELANRVIAFGPYVRVSEPEWLVSKVRDRILRQMEM